MNDETNITSVVLNSGHVVFVDRWMVEIEGGTEVEEWRKRKRKRMPYAASQQPEHAKI